MELIVCVNDIYLIKKYRLNKYYSFNMNNLISLFSYYTFASIAGQTNSTCIYKPLLTLRLSLKVIAPTIIIFIVTTTTSKIILYIFYYNLYFSHIYQQEQRGVPFLLGELFKELFSFPGSGNKTSYTGFQHMSQKLGRK